MSLHFILIETLKVYYLELKSFYNQQIFLYFLKQKKYFSLIINYYKLLLLLFCIKKFLYRYNELKVEPNL
jgi:hypothetical protein